SLPKMARVRAEYSTFGSPLGSMLSSELSIRTWSAKRPRIAVTTRFATTTASGCRTSHRAKASMGKGADYIDPPHPGARRGTRGPPSPRRTPGSPSQPGVDRRNRADAHPKCDQKAHSPSFATHHPPLLFEEHPLTSRRQDSRGDTQHAR